MTKNTWSALFCDTLPTIKNEEEKMQPLFCQNALRWILGIIYPTVLSLPSLKVEKPICPAVLKSYASCIYR